MAVMLGQAVPFSQPSAPPENARFRKGRGRRLRWHRFHARARGLNGPGTLRDLYGPFSPFSRRTAYLVL